MDIYLSIKIKSFHNKKLIVSMKCFTQAFHILRFKDSNIRPIQNNELNI